MSAPTRRAAPLPSREALLAPPVRSYLESLGYRVWVDPDGSDYFDVIARRSAEVGLVEMKLADWRSVVRQAVRRRGWADWVAVALPRESTARRALEATRTARLRPIGVWVVDGGTIRVLRDASPWPSAEGDPFRPLREHLRESLDLLEAGLLPEGTKWRFVQLPAARRRGRKTLSTAHWRLEEFAEEPGRPLPVSPGTGRTASRSAPRASRS